METDSWNRFAAELKRREDVFQSRSGKLIVGCPFRVVFFFFGRRARRPASNSLSLLVTQICTWVSRKSMAGMTTPEQSSPARSAPRTSTLWDCVAILMRSTQLRQIMGYGSPAFFSLCAGLYLCCFAAQGERKRFPFTETNYLHLVFGESN